MIIFTQLDAIFGDAKLRKIHILDNLIDNYYKQINLSIKKKVI